MSYPIRQGDIPGVQLRCEAAFDVPAEDLWPWLVEPERMRRWLASEIETRSDGEEGWIWRGTDEVGRSLVESTRSLAVDPGRRWVASLERLDEGWESATRLNLQVVTGNPCRLSVLQDGFERLSLSRCLTVWEFYRRRWRAALSELGMALEADLRP